MGDLFNDLKDFTAPSLFIFFGFILVLVSLGLIPSILKESQNVNKKLIAILGSFFILLGVLLFAIPSQTKNAHDKAQRPNLAWRGYPRECEYPDNHTIGQAIYRKNASGEKVHGQFGCGSKEFEAKAGYVEYRNIRIPELSNLFLRLHYSKHSESSVPIEIFFDKEKERRAAIYLENQSDWNKFAVKDSISLGNIQSGLHTLIFKTKGQEYGVADLDKFELFK